MSDVISIIIVNYNGKKWLTGLFDSLAAQTYEHFEIIFVDNGSKDDSIEFIKSNYAGLEINIVTNAANLGFAGGNNAGFKHVRGRYVLLLNNDVRLNDDYLEKFVEGFRKIPQADSLQSKMILMDDPARLDICGSYWTDSTFLYHYGYRQDETLEKYNTPMPVFSNKGASMMIRREAIERIGLFDDDFWAYYEETDFCHRVWLAGGECWYWPAAVMYHASGGTSVHMENSLLQFHNFKNKLLSFLTNFEWITLVRVLPIYVILSISMSFFWLFSGKWKHCSAIYRAFWWNMVNFGQTLQKRRAIQSFRTRTDREIFTKVKKNPAPRYYYYFLTGLDKFKE